MNRNACFLAVIVLIVSGCTAAQPATGVVPTGGPPVIVPGEPGQAAATATPGQTLGASREPNAADVRFAEQMITHHRAALAMAALVRGRTTTPQVLATAARVEVSQQAEITWLTGWLAGLGRQAPHGLDHVHDHDLARLRGLSGSAFDQAFLRDMITHHEGALAMAEQVLGAGADPGIGRLAADIDAGQTAEIARMRAALSSAGA